MIFQTSLFAISIDLAMSISRGCDGAFASMMTRCQAQTGVIAITIKMVLYTMLSLHRNIDRKYTHFKEINDSFDSSQSQIPMAMKQRRCPKQFAIANMVEIALFAISLHHYTALCNADL